MMEPLGETPRKRIYSLRNKIPVKYNELEISMEEQPKSRKQAKVVDSSIEEEDGKENDDTVESSDEEISEYEKLRLKNVEENRRVMIELGILDPEKERRSQPKVNRPKPKPQKPRSPKSKNTEPTKRSLRLQMKTPAGKDIPLFFYETPTDSPSLTQEKTRLEEEVLPMGEDGEGTDFLDSLKATLSEDSGTCSQQSVDSLIKDMRNLEFATLERVLRSRILSMCVHPIESKLLVIAGSVNGELGICDVNDGNVAVFTPHLRSLNCVSVNTTDQSKLFTTSHEGTVRRGDINKSVFDLIYQTDEERNMCHLTWHSQIDAHSLLIAHGTGDAGVSDTRAKAVQQWFHCHPRSIRTTQLHPTQPNYFITASGIGECKIWDLRNNNKHIEKYIGELVPPRNGKGLTSAFFSPDGNKVVTTCNDDFIRLYDSSDVENPKETHKIVHDNHTGRWLSVFKTVWHPQNSDLFFVGSMLHPRRIQLYSGCGRLVRELKDDQMSTIVSVIALHPTLPVVVGGNSSGKAHIFTTPQLIGSISY